MTRDERLSRRAVIAGAAATAGAIVLKKLAPSQAEAQTAAPSALDPSMAPGTPTSAVGARSAFENPTRAPVGVLSGASFTPLHELTGTMTPSDLVFERHHSGVPAIDPKRYKLLVHGLADTAMTFTLADLHRLPSAARTHFL